MRAVLLLPLIACASEAADPPPDPPPPDCAPVLGTQHGLAISSGGEQRHYFLHVPAQTACEPVPLWIDFHGTAGDPAPEEAYGLAAAVAVADREGVILVRPRSRSSPEGDGQIYRWDQNPGDLERNRTLVHDLVTDLETRYAIDPARIIISGFSSGTNMAAQFMRPDELPIAGIGDVGGGFWFGTQADYTRLPAHIYTVTGFRDYMVQNFDPLRDMLRARGVGDDVWYWRQVDTGHELYAWHFDEMLPWLLRGERRDPGTLAAGWTDESIATDRAVLDLQRHGADVLAGGSEGAIWRRTGGAWTELPGITGDRNHVTRLCVDGDTVYAAAQTSLFRSPDAGDTWSRLQAVPELEQHVFGAAYVNAVDCGPGRSLLAGGWWTGAESSDAALHWDPAPMVATYHYDAAVADVVRAPSGTAVAVGYAAYVGRRGSGGTFQPIDLGFDTEWFNAVATDGGTHWWIVGEAGTIYGSTTDGQTWTKQTTGSVEDLYATAFRDANTGVAVGAHGTVLLTINGGATWTDISLGTDGFLGAAVWLDATTVLVAGEHGTVARRTVP